MTGKIRLASRPYHAQIETTTACNLNCIMCSREKYHGKGKHLSRKILRKLLDEVFPYLQEAILSSFGEPLLYPHLDELLESLQRFPRLSIGFYTNLIPLTEEKAEQIIRQGVSYLCVSIDGATKETYERIRQNGRWEQLIEKLELLNSIKKKYRSRRPFLHLVIVGMTENIRELPLFVDFAQKYGFGAIKVSHNLYVDDPSMEYLSLVNEKALTNRMYAEAYEKAILAGILNNFAIKPFRLSKEEESTGAGHPSSSVHRTIPYCLNKLYFVQVLPQLMRIKNTWDFSGKSWRYFAPLFFRKIYRRYLSSGMSASPGLYPFPNDAPPYHCGNPWTHVRIDVDGSVYPCCFIDTVMGDLSTQSFDEIWNGGSYRNLRESIVTRKFWPTCRKSACNWVAPGASESYGVEFLKAPKRLNLIAGEESQVLVRVRNKSRFAWTKEEKVDCDYFTLSYRLFTSDKHLVMEGARGKVSRDVPPGGEADIRLKIWAIPSAGEYEIRLDMVHEGVTFFSDRGNFGHVIPVKVSHFYRALITPERAFPTEITAGDIIGHGVVLQNISDCVWRAQGKKSVRLSYHWRVPSGSYAVFEGVRTSLPWDLSPAGAVNIELKVQAPNDAGEYILEIDPVFEHHAWFSMRGQPPVSFPVRVIAPSDISTLA
jgi:radical SAM protein with 4Fe4S-binding SPASM domain